MGSGLRKPNTTLKNAEHTLALGRDCPFDTVCFHAQQCVEKYLKAILTISNVDFPKTHDLTELHALLSPNIRRGIFVSDLAELNPYVIETRDPGPWEPQTRDDAVRAVEIARHVREAVRSQLPADCLQA